MTKEAGPGSADLFLAELVEKMEREPERHLYEVHCFFGEMERKFNAGEPIPKSEVEAGRKLRDLLRTFSETGKHLWAWDLIEKKADDDEHCQWLLERKRWFDRNTDEEKRNWAIVIANNCWEEVNKIEPDKIDSLDKALAEIPEDTVDIREREMLLKAQMVNLQLEVVDLIDKGNFDPDQVFELRLQILCMVENLGFLAGLFDIPDIADIEEV